MMFGRPPNAAYRYLAINYMNMCVKGLPMQLLAMLAKSPPLMSTNWDTLAMGLSHRHVGCMCLAISMRMLKLFDKQFMSGLFILANLIEAFEKRLFPWRNSVLAKRDLQTRSCLSRFMERRTWQTCAGNIEDCVSLATVLCWKYTCGPNLQIVLFHIILNSTAQPLRGHGISAARWGLKRTPADPTSRWQRNHCCQKVCK